MRWATWLAWALWAFDVAVVIGMLRALRRAASLRRRRGPAVHRRVRKHRFPGRLTRADQPCRLADEPRSSLFTIGAITGPLYSYVQHNGPQALAPWIAWVSTFVWTLGFGPSTTFLLLLFPDGRLPSRRWRPLAWVSGVSSGRIGGGPGNHAGPHRVDRGREPGRRPGRWPHFGHGQRGSRACCSPAPSGAVCRWWCATGVPAASSGSS